MAITITLRLTDAQATLLQRALDDAVDGCVKQFDLLCDDGAKVSELESARRLYRQAADLAKTLERRCACVALPPRGKDSA